LPGEEGRGYTIGMKTAISIPDGIFKEAERLARKLKKSRSQIFSEAIAEYLSRHGYDSVTEAMDEICSKMDVRQDPALSAAARRILERSEW
jgi:predicted transcriptional regulator